RSPRTGGRWRPPAWTARSASGGPTRRTSDRPAPAPPARRFRLERRAGGLDRLPPAAAADTHSAPPAPTPASAPMPARTARGSAGQRSTTSAKSGDSRARSAKQDAKTSGVVAEDEVGSAFVEPSWRTENL